MDEPKRDVEDPFAIFESTIGGDSEDATDAGEGSFTAPGTLTIYDTPSETGEAFPETPETTAPETWTIPDFKADAAWFTRYDQLRLDFMKHALDDVEDNVRTQFAQRREALRSEILLFADRESVAQEKADLALGQYFRLYPRSVDRSRGKPRALPPSFWTNLFSLWGAQKVYAAVQAAFDAVEEARRARRRREDDEEKLDNETSKAVQRALTQAKKEKVDPEGSETFLKKPDVVEARERIEKIKEERAAYAERLAAGKVSDLEARERGMAEKNWTFAETPFGSSIICRIVTFGTLAYFVLRDEERNERLVSYDRRLEPLINFVFDVYRIGDRFESRIVRNAAQFPMNPLELYMKALGEPDQARAAFRSDRTALRADRSGLEPPPVGPGQEELIELLVPLARSVDKEIANVTRDDGT